MKTFTADTLETAITLLCEWNHGSRTRIALESSTDAQWLRQAIRDARELERLEKGLRRREEYACSYPMTEAEAAARDRKDDKAARRVAAILKPYGMTAKIGGDVRGSQIHLMTPKTERSNTFGGKATGWAV